MTLHRRGRHTALQSARRSRRQRIASALIEALEDRRLLTVFVGGESFDFQDPTNTANNIRITFNGNMRAEVVGAYVDTQTNVPTLQDIPGVIRGNALGRNNAPVLGGIGGGPGVQVIGDTTIADPITNQNFPTVPDPNIYLGALACDDAPASPTYGWTIAFNLVPTPAPSPPGSAESWIQVVRLNTTTTPPALASGTVIRSIANTANMPKDPTTNFSTVTAIPAADFRNGVLYFVAQDNTPTGTPPTTGFDQDVLYTLNLTTGAVTRIAGNFGSGAASGSFNEVRGLAFDTGANPQMWAVVRNPGNNNAPELRHVNMLNTNNNIGAVNVITGDATNPDVANISDIEFIPTDATGVYAITDAAGGGQLIRISLATGIATLIGTIPPGFEGLTYNPVLIDPFTQLQGALIGTDVEDSVATYRDTLCYINGLHRSGLNVFRIQVTESDVNSSISISSITANGQLQPFTGSVGTFNVFDNNNPGTPYTVTPTDGTGTVWLGVRRPATNPISNNAQIQPVISINSTAPVGAVAPTSGRIDAGVFVQQNLLIPLLPGLDPIDSLLGRGLARVGGMSVGADGKVAIVDNTGTNNRLSLVDISSGIPSASVPTNIRQLPNTPVRGIQAIAWGDPLGTGAKLYGIFTIGPTNAITLGTLGADPATPATFGVFTPIGPLGGTITAVSSMVFSASGTLYVASGSRIYTVNPTTGTATLLTTVFDLTAAGNPPILVGGIAFDGGGMLLAHDLTNGRLVDIDLTGSPGAAGGRVATVAQSLPDTVRTIAYDAVVARLLAVDNSTGAVTPAFGTASASLFTFRGTKSNSAVPQDLGRFACGGVVTGQVYVSGSMNTFYAGYVLTGDAAGQDLTFPTFPGNFTVGGELRNLLVKASIGSDNGDQIRASYNSGFDLSVGGKLGQIFAGQDLYGSIAAYNYPKLLPQGTYETEYEARPGTGNNPYARFADGIIQDPILYNDTFDSPQYLGAINVPAVGNSIVDVVGSLSNARGDSYDYYGVSLLAGATITVQVTPLGFGWFSVGVFDPDGREVAVDRSDWSAAEFENKQFQVKIDRPGVWRFAVSVGGAGQEPDADFNGARFGYGGDEFLAPTTGGGDYLLYIQNIGDLTVGAVAAGRTICDGRTTGTQIFVPYGDLGAVVAGNTIAAMGIPNVATTKFLEKYTGTAPAVEFANYDVRYGNLRSIQAADIGRDVQGAIRYGPNIFVPRGSVGLVSAIGTPDPQNKATIGGILALNPEIWASNPPPVSDRVIQGVQALYGAAREAAIGGDYQVVSAYSTFAGALMANGSIGTVKAGDMATDTAGSFVSTPSFFVADADQSGATGKVDGYIDLIDVRGNFGTLNAGGPVIITGPGGNMRYIHVNGTVYRDHYFGSGTGESTSYQAGESVQLKDDSGTAIVISPGNTSYTGSAPATITSLTTYGIRGSGGVAVVQIIANGSLSISGNASAGAAAGAEIGLIRLDGEGHRIALDAATQKLVLDPADPNAQPMSLNFSGNARVDILDILARKPTAINNNTPGELVNITTESIGTLTGNNIGVNILHSTPSEIFPQEPRAFLCDTDPSLPENVPLQQDGSYSWLAFPFANQHIGVITGDIITLTARDSVGNVVLDPYLLEKLATQDRGWTPPREGYIPVDFWSSDLKNANSTIGTLIADSDNLHPTGFQGVTGPVVGLRRSTDGYGNATGTIQSATVGMGILTSGTGNLSHAGLYASGPIQSVTGANSNMYGNVVSTSRIGTINISNGSIINADIDVVGGSGVEQLAPGQSREFATTPTLGGPSGTPTQANYAITAVNVSGPSGGLLGGGIIGTVIQGASIGDVTAKGGFGIINSGIYAQASGMINSIQAEGYGVRDVSANAGMRLGRMVATGNGVELPATRFTPVVRRSEGMDFDPFTHFQPNLNSDLHKYLGTSLIQQINPEVTRSGLIAGTTIRAGRTMDLAQAWRIGPSSQIRANTFTDFDVASEITTVQTTENADQVQITTGALVNYTIGKDSVNANITVAGTFSNINITGSLVGFGPAAIVQAVGPAGDIGNILIGQYATGTVSAQHNIFGTVKVKLGWIKPYGKLIKAGVVIA